MSISSVTECVYQFNSNVSKVGNFSSPNYPNKYDPDTNCRYEFIGNDYETLKIYFVVFDLQPPYISGCLYDYVDVSTISAAEMKELVGRYCGNKTGVPLFSMHPKIQMIFRTDHVGEHQGFYGMYEFRNEKLIPPPKSFPPDLKGCGGIVTGVGGLIVSPGYPQSFPKDVDCVWLIRVDPGQYIQTRIMDLQLHGSIAHCNDAELSIYDGYTTFEVNPRILKKFCGDLNYYKSEAESTLISKRNRLLVSKLNGEVRYTYYELIPEEGYLVSLKAISKLRARYFKID
ncbi:CUB domain-containing protein 2 [Nephila pilipes]|uniref:CUB domain-containing protein 2 n=1 Tax=Nephila pilipes TaxID=299642 RepID=A0A8X6NNY9_NEPPI|nr:CUB domain-containing protein 2 [Nephila pilipes]